MQVGPADYIAPTPVPNFRAAWEALPEEAEMADDYGLGQVCRRRPVVAATLWPLMTQPAAAAAVSTGLLLCHHSGAGRCLSMRQAEHPAPAGPSC